MRALSLALLLVCAGCSSTSSTAGASATLVAEHAHAPDFRARDQDGRERTSAEFRGKPLILYFYPKDQTPGCTHEACAFRDAWDRISAAGVNLVGVSTDDVDSHAHFAREHHLPFPLLADTDAAIVHAYGVGTTFGIAHRVTFIIDANGNVAHVFPNVDPGVHVDEVLAAIAALPH